MFGLDLVKSQDNEQVPLFLRKLVLGIPAQSSGKNTEPLS
jgi:hypothetical protein